MLEETKEKRKTYYVEYYKKNRDRLLEYQHHYNQTHLVIKPVPSANKKCGRLSVTRANIIKRLEMNARRVLKFKAQLLEQIADSNPVASLPLS
jgi:hypothetical protein